MTLRSTIQNWEMLGSTDPLWAILSDKKLAGGKWDVEEFFKTGEREIAEVMEYARRFNLPLARRRALDFGCGVGRLTQPLANYFSEVCGVDCATSMIQLAEAYNRHGQRCRYFVNKTDNLRIFPDNHFDFIYSAITLQHVEPQDAKKYISEFVRILAPRGLIVFQLPDGERRAAKIQSSAAKRFLKTLMPSWALYLYRVTRYGQAGFIVTYGIPKTEVMQVLESAGARVLDVNMLETRAKGRKANFRYCATKQ